MRLTRGAIARVQAGFFVWVHLRFTGLASTSFDDLGPLGRMARGICTVEQVVGSLFVAIWIVRLVGAYSLRCNAVICEGV